MLLELDEYDVPLSDALESDEPEWNTMKTLNKLSQKKNLTIKQINYIPEPDELDRFFFRRLLPAIENEIGLRGAGGGGDGCNHLEIS